MGRTREALEESGYLTSAAGDQPVETPLTTITSALKGQIVSTRDLPDGDIYQITAGSRIVELVYTINSLDDEAQAGLPASVAITSPESAGPLRTGIKFSGIRDLRVDPTAGSVSFIASESAHLDSKAQRRAALRSYDVIGTSVETLKLPVAVVITPDSMLVRYKGNPSQISR